MRINAYPFPGAIPEKQYFGKTVVVIDLLRSSTCMIEALQNGATQLIPARDAGEAMAFAAHLGRSDSLIAGESGGVMMPGFDMGNSPFEFKREAVEKKTVVFCTSNGTVAIHAARTAAHLLIGALRNRAAVAQKAAALEDDILLICAGTRGECSMDDMVAAGGILTGIRQALAAEPEMNDFARVCGHLYGAWLTGGLDIEAAAHYRTLMALGFMHDIAYCLEEDKTGLVPQYENGSIR